MARPSNESKRQAALEQVKAMKAEGMSIENIRAKLVDIGLTVKQIDDVAAMAAPVAPVAVLTVKPANVDRIKQVLLEVGHFLEHAHK